LTQHKNGISALALRRQLGVSYDQRKSLWDNTAWLLKHMLMQAMGPCFEADLARKGECPFEGGSTRKTHSKLVSAC